MNIPAEHHGLEPDCVAGFVGSTVVEYSAVGFGFRMIPYGRFDRLSDQSPTGH